MAKTDWREHRDDSNFLVCVHLAIGAECGRSVYVPANRLSWRRHPYPLLRQERIGENLDKLGEDFFGFICPNCGEWLDGDGDGADGADTCFCYGNDDDAKMSALVKGIASRPDHDLVSTDDELNFARLAYWVWDYDTSNRSPTYWLRAVGWEHDIPLTTKEVEAVCLGMWLADSEQGTDHLYRAIALGETHT